MSREKESPFGGLYVVFAARGLRRETLLLPHVAPHQYLTQKSGRQFSARQDAQVRAQPLLESVVSSCPPRAILPGQKTSKSKNENTSGFKVRNACQHGVREAFYGMFLIGGVFNRQIPNLSST